MGAKGEILTRVWSAMSMGAPPKTPPVSEYIDSLLFGVARARVGVDSIIGVLTVLAMAHNKDNATQRSNQLGVQEI